MPIELFARHKIKSRTGREKGMTPCAHGLFRKMNIAERKTSYYYYAVEVHRKGEALKTMKI